MARNKQTNLYWVYWHGDFLADTQTLAAHERCILLWLQVTNWGTGPLPREPEALAKICGLKVSEFRPIWQTLQPRFVRVKGGLAHPKMIHDREAALLRKERKSKAGHTGGVASAKARAREAGPEHIGEAVTKITDRLRGQSQ